jgi:diphthine synthase
MVLYVVGLGLCDERDVTLRGLAAVRRCARVYLEAYTSVLPGVDKSRLERLYGREVVIADREMVESRSDEILGGDDGDDDGDPQKRRGGGDVAFLVVGDPFGATTHTDLVTRARQRGIPVRVVHNASVMNAVGACGLQLYRYGEAVSVPFFSDTWRPDSFYGKIAANVSLGLHTLCLLDIKVKEPDLEQLARGRTVYEPPRFMTIGQAARQLLEVERAQGLGVCTERTLAVGLARLGCPDEDAWADEDGAAAASAGEGVEGGGGGGGGEGTGAREAAKDGGELKAGVGAITGPRPPGERIVAGPLGRLRDVDFGPPLHSLVIVGEMHEMEEEMLKQFMLPDEDD